MTSTFNKKPVRFIGDIAAIVVNEELLDTTKQEAAKAADPLLGMDIHTVTGYYPRIGETTSFGPVKTDVYYKT
jgi:hypothetical protein